MPGWGGQFSVDDAYLAVSTPFTISMYSTSTSSPSIQSNGVRIFLSSFFLFCFNDLQFVCFDSKQLHSECFVPFEREREETRYQHPIIYVVNSCKTAYFQKQSKEAGHESAHGDVLLLDKRNVFVPMALMRREQ